MQWPWTVEELGAETLRDVLLALGAGVAFLVALWTCLRASRGRIERTVLTHLLHRVHDRRGELFASHHPPRPSGDARRRFLNSARERLSVSEFFKRGIGS